MSIAAATIPTVVPSPVTPSPPRKTIADLLHELGDIPADRVRLFPYPGTATEADAIHATETGRSCELIDGTLVEKAMGVPESFIASLVLQFVGPFVRINKLGFTTAPDGMYKMIHGNIREPDVSYTSNARRTRPTAQVGEWCPDLCIEIISPRNSRREMVNKRKEYFKSGCKLVWIIDHRKRTVDVFKDEKTSLRLKDADVLDGGTVLPGFSLPLEALFTAFDEGMPAS